MECLFEKKYDGLDGGDFDKIFTEYVDLSGIGATKEYDLMTAIHNVQSRMIYMAGMIDIQKEFLKNFDMPFVNAFPKFREKGHRLVWDPENPGLFVQQLQMVETMEKKSKAELDTKMKELTVLKKDGIKPNSSGRQDFVKKLNQLNKAGYKIDKDKSDMEELALMIKEHDEQMREMAAEQEQKKTRGQ